MLTRGTIPLIQRLIIQNSYSMGMLTDKLAEKQGKKAQEEFRKEIEHMANKPSFTLLDYKQRILD